LCAELREPPHDPRRLAALLIGQALEAFFSHRFQDGSSASWLSRVSGWPTLFVNLACASAAAAGSIVCCLVSVVTAQHAPLVVGGVGSGASSVVCGICARTRSSAHS